MRRYSIVLAAFATLAAGQASVQAAPADQPREQCFRSSDIDSSVQANRTQLNIKTRGNRYYQIQTKGVCFTSIGTEPYVLTVRSGGDLICRPIDMDLAAGPSGFKTPCIVDKIVPMTKDQISALPKREQP